MSKTLVVGHKGFIGSYLMDEIKADGMDLKDGNDVRYGIDGHYKTIIFLACNQENSHKAYRENIQMYYALEYYRRRYPKTYLVYISSAAIYSSTSIYAQSKRLGEIYAKRFRNYAILRLSNVYGHGDGHGAPDKFMRGEKTIHGDGFQIRDLIPVELVVTAILNCLETGARGTFNVSSGKGTTVNEMFKLFGEGKPRYAPKTYAGVSMSILEPGRIEW